MKRIAVDWDGTLVENVWPEMGDWRPGAIEFVADMLDAGVAVEVFTARLNPTYPDGSGKPILVMLNDQRAIRSMLDAEGFAAVDIFPHPKPNVDLFIDDRAIWYPGTKRAWPAMVVKVFARLGILDPA